jgi:hypothetical protein
MVNDMLPIWIEFTNEVNAHVEESKGVVDQAWTKARGHVQVTDADDDAAENTTQCAMRTLAGIIKHRRRMSSGGIMGAITKFRADLLELNINMFSGKSTSFVGKIMEATYLKANAETGRTMLSALDKQDNSN